MSDSCFSTAQFRFRFRARGKRRHIWVWKEVHVNRIVTTRTKVTSCALQHFTHTTLNTSLCKVVLVRSKRRALSTFSDVVPHLQASSQQTHTYTHLYTYRQRKPDCIWVSENICIERWNTSRFEKLHNEELFNVYSSPNIIQIVKSGMTFAGHVACMREKNALRIFVGKPKEKRLLGS
jgi:hypothetical protein